MVIELTGTYEIPPAYQYAGGYLFCRDFIFLDPGGVWGKASYPNKYRLKAQHCVYPRHAEPGTGQVAFSEFV